MIHRILNYEGKIVREMNLAVGLLPFPALSAYHKHIFIHVGKIQSMVSDGKPIIGISLIFIP